MKTHWEIGSIDPRVINIGTWWS